MRRVLAVTVLAGALDIPQNKRRRLSQCDATVTVCASLSSSAHVT